MVKSSEQLTTPLTADELRDFTANGYHVARGLLSTDEAATIRDAFMEVAQNGPIPGFSDGSKDFAPDDPLAKYPRMMQPHRHPDQPVAPLAQRYGLDARIGAILQQLLEDEPLLAQTMFYFKPPGSRGQDLHQDNFYLHVKPGTCMAAWIAVDDADRENGGMVVVPGSHRLDIACPEKRPELLGKSFTDVRVDPPAGYREQPVDLKAGDVLFFGGSVIHGSYPNTSENRFRRALINHYIPTASREVAKHYHPLYNRRGEVVSRAVAVGGGPCGEIGAAVAPH